MTSPRKDDASKLAKWPILHKTYLATIPIIFPSPFLTHFKRYRLLCDKEKMIVPEKYDVICKPRSRQEANSVGNRRFAVVVFKHIDGRPELLETPQTKADVIRKIVSAWRECRPGGRFLVEKRSNLTSTGDSASGTHDIRSGDDIQRDSASVEFHELSEEEAIQWVTLFIDKVVPQRQSMSAPAQQSPPIDEHQVATSTTAHDASTAAIPPVAV